MNRRLKKWIDDSIAADIKVTYDSQLFTLMEYEFTGRYVDFYVNLITRLADLLDAANYSNNDWNKDMMEIACGLEVFHDRFPNMEFEGIDKNSTLLYISTIYYLCGYPAVANVYIKLCNPTLLKSSSAQVLMSIISGSGDIGGIVEMLSENVKDEFSKKTDEIQKKNEAFQYESCYDFFESTLLQRVLEKFAVDNLREDLYRFAPNTDWNDYIRYAVNRHILSFLPSQREAFENGLLSFKRSFSLHMPTSAGKSFITELLIYQELRDNPEAKVLYLAPLRSLSHELKVKYTKIAKALNFSLRCIYGGSNFSVAETFFEDANMLIATPEAFMGLEGAIDDVLSRFTLVICDEGQLLVSERRGLEYELLLSRMLRYDSIRFLFISAIVPNVGEINTWLGGGDKEICSSNYRPTDLRFGYFSKTDDGIDIKLLVPRLNSDILLKSFITTHQKSSSNKWQACSIALKSLNAGSVMVYTSFKSGPASCEKYGYEILNLIDKKEYASPARYLKKEQIDRLRLYQEYTKYIFGDDYSQTYFINRGFAIHHGSVPQCMREIIETAFENGVIRMVICNKTLAEGVNFPVKTLVLGDIRNPKGGKGFMPLDDLMNVIGRAGRAGKETYGMVIANASMDWYVHKAAKGENLQPAKGQMSDLLDQIDKAQMNKRDILTDEEIQDLLDSTEYSDSLDKMIMLSLDLFTENDTDVDDISSSSLTYHLADERGKNNLKRVFNTRYKALRSLSQENYNTYRDTGLSPKEITGLSSIIKDDMGWNNVSYRDLCSKEFILSMFKLTKYTDDESKEDIYVHILLLWMHGLQYINIAQETGLSIDEIVNHIEDFTRDFLMKSKAIIRYVSHRFNIENDAFIHWPIFVEKGLCTSTQSILCRKGLSDRIAIHAVDTYITQQSWANVGEENLRDFLIGLLRNRRKDLYLYLHSQGIPALSLERVVSFLEIR